MSVITGKHLAASARDALMTEWEPYITVRAVQPVVAGLEALGHRVDEILAEAAIDRAILTNVEGRVPHLAMMGLWNRAVSITGDANLGIHLAEAAMLRQCGCGCFAGISRANIRAGCNHANQSGRRAIMQTREAPSDLTL